MAKRAAWLDLIVLCLATWRLSRMVTEEDGPAGLFTKVRESTGAEDNGVMMPWDELSSLGRLTQCPYCISVWLSLFLIILRALNTTMYELVALSLCGSAATVLIEEAKQS